MILCVYFSTLLVDQSSHAINSSFIMIKSNVILFCWFSLIHITFANRLGCVCESTEDVCELTVCEVTRLRSDRIPSWQLSSSSTSFMRLFSGDRIPSVDNVALLLLTLVFLFTEESNSIKIGRKIWSFCRSSAEHVFTLPCPAQSPRGFYYA